MVKNIAYLILGLIIIAVAIRIAVWVLKIAVGVLGYVINLALFAFVIYLIYLGIKSLISSARR
ncbi:MAG: hypothetical protein SNJ70_00255 [Armatimonadota bacterium]